VGELAPGFPCDIEEQNAAGEGEADDRNQAERDQCEGDAQDRRSANANDDRLTALGRGEPTNRKANHDRIITGQDQIDHQHLN
jgi:hypothetical protein